MDPLRLLVSGLSPGKWHVNSQGLSQGIDSKPTEAQDCAPTQAAEVDTVLGSQNLQRIAPSPPLPFCRVIRRTPTKVRLAIHSFVEWDT